jgi:hypothetical protein
MKLEKALQQLADAEEYDWEHLSLLERIGRAPQEVWVNKNDCRVRIEEMPYEDSESRKFEEEWTKRFPDKKAFRSEYVVYFGSSPIYRTMLVSVDGGRATLPLESLTTKKVDSRDYAVALAVNQPNSKFHDYFKRAKLKR